MREKNNERTLSSQDRLSLKEQIQHDLITLLSDKIDQPTMDKTCDIIVKNFNPPSTFEIVWAYICSLPYPPTETILSLNIVEYYIKKTCEFINPNFANHNFEKIWQHLCSLPNPSVEIILSGNIIEHYIKKTCEFIDTDSSIILSMKPIASSSNWPLAALLGATKS